MQRARLGQWWTPLDPERKLPGTLIQSDNGTVLLQVDGHFEGNTSPSGLMTPMDDIPMILGEERDRGVTLIDCRVVQGFGIPGLLKTGQVLKPRLIANDVYFADRDDFKLRSLSIRYSNLNEWMNASGFSIDFGSSPFSATVKYVTPDPVSANLASGAKVSFRSSFAGPDPSPDRFQIRLAQHAQVDIQVPDQRLFEELAELHQTIANLISLGVGQPIEKLDMNASAVDSTAPEANTKLLHFSISENRPSPTHTPDDVRAPEMLFELAHIKANLDSILETWCRRESRLRPLYDLYFAIRRSPTMYVEHKFLSTFQALEAFDRRSYETPAADAEAHTAKLQRIYSGVVVPSDLEWLQDELQYSHEPSARNRLKRLISTYDASWLFDSPKRDMSLALELRNYYTHYDRSLETRLPPPGDRMRIIA